MATTDLHMHVLAYDYLRDRPRPGIGLAAVARNIARARAEAPNTLLVDNGDFLQGTPLGDFLAGRPEIGRSRIHPAVALMNELGYDAGTIGNHDFHHGADFLIRALIGARFPFTCANARVRRDRGLIRPSLLLERTLICDDGIARPIRIGVLGLTPPHSAAVDRELEHRLTTEDMLTAARREIGHLRARGADLVLALAHSGISQGTSAGETENLARQVAALPGVDALVAGHTHMVFPGPAFDADADIDPVRGLLHGKPAVMPGFWGSHLGIIDLTLHKGAGWTVTASAVRAEPTLGADPAADPAMALYLAGAAPRAGPDRDGPRPPQGARVPGDTPPVGAGWMNGPPLPQPDATAAAGHPAMSHDPPHRPGFRGYGRRADPGAGGAAGAVLDAHEATLRRFRRRIAHTESPLNSFFTLIGNDAGLRLVAMAQQWQLRRMLGAAHRHLPILSAAAPFRAGGRGGATYYTDVPSGALRLRDLADLYLFPNRLVAVEITGAQLAQWLERAAGIFAPLVPGAQDQPLIDSGFPGYFFDVVYGLTWIIDPSRPPRYDVAGLPLHDGPGRVTDLRHEGRPVAAADRFVLATNGFRRTACPLFGPLARTLPVLADSDILISDALRRYVTTRRRIQVPARAPWRLAPMPGTTALYFTAPEALDHLPALQRPDVEALDIDACGFARLRIHL